MTSLSLNHTKLVAQRWFKLNRKAKLTLIYFIGLLIPFAATKALHMDSKGIYVSVLSMANLIAMMAFFVQFPLGSRLKKMALFSNIDWNISKHKTAGKWIGGFFLLHPLLIVAPRFLVSFDDAVTSIITVVTEPQTLTGVIAWVLMILWVLTSVYKNKLPIKYETWRLTHAVGFIAICILSTLHITTVGSHGQFQSQFTLLWWALCGLSVAMVAYNYVIKPAKLRAKPFTLTQVSKISSRDWLVTLRNQSQHEFNFEAGQFVWLNTSGSTKGVNEHPFSIASCKKDLPNLSFIIRELGDYTATLGTLKVGQDVYIDGPYGSMSLRDSDHCKGITLVAGGAGIGPMLSLLRELAQQKDTRPIRLVYGNNSLDQMVCQQEITELESSMADFQQQLVCADPSADRAQAKHSNIYTGVIDQHCIEQSINMDCKADWAMYLCGPAPMIFAAKTHIKTLQMPSENIHYEQLAF